MPSLLDPDTDELYVDTSVQRTALLAAAELSEVERELRAQIDVVVDVGLRVSTNGRFIQRTAPRNGGRSNQPAGESGKATTSSSPREKRARSSSRERITVIDYRPLRQAWNG